MIEVLAKLWLGKYYCHCYGEEVVRYMQVHPQSRLECTSSPFKFKIYRMGSDIHCRNKTTSGVATLFTFRLTPAPSSSRWTHALIKRHSTALNHKITSLSPCWVGERAITRIPSVFSSSGPLVSKTPSSHSSWTRKIAYLRAGRFKNVKSALTVDMAVAGVPSARHAYRHRPYSSRSHIQIRAHWPLSASNCAPRR